jgi:Mrp family chromosome partitioning ATPase
MSNFDAAFIKAYGKTRVAGEAIEGIRGGRDGESVAGHLPGQGSRPTLHDLDPGNVDRASQVRVFAPSEAGGEVATACPDESRPRHPRPRLTIHTEDEEEEAVASGSTPTASSVQCGAALAQPPGETAATARPRFIGMEDLESLLHRRSHAGTTRQQPLPQQDVAEDSAPRANRGQRAQGAYQVEAFAWPTICQELLDDARERFDALGERLIVGSGESRRVIAVATCRPKTGGTTLTLAIASHLAHWGLDVAVFDADLEAPELAGALSVLPQFSWHDVLLQHLPVTECWIEARADRTTLVPLTKPLRGIDAAAAARLPEVTALLRENFDLTLVDLGPAAAALKTGMLAALGVDGALLVQDVRHAAPHQLEEVCRQLLGAGIGWLGVAQNFV